jgi:ABC-2 type transport system ATP-binding protein
MKGKFSVYWVQMVQEKSTTLEIIETLRAKTSGKVIVSGHDLDLTPNEIKKIIGVQLQTSGFYPNLNLVQLIDLFGGLYNRRQMRWLCSIW